MVQKHSVEKNEEIWNGRVKTNRSDDSTKDVGMVTESRKKILIPLLGDDVAPRFDLAPEAVIAVVELSGRVRVEKSIVLSHASAEALCRLIMTENVDTVVCCAIEEEYYQYLIWKKVVVVDSVMGPFSKVLQRVETGGISSGDILLERG